MARKSVWLTGGKKRQKQVKTGDLQKQSVKKSLSNKGQSEEYPQNTQSLAVQQENSNLGLKRQIQQQDQVPSKKYKIATKGRNAGLQVTSIKDRLKKPKSQIQQQQQQIQDSKKQQKEEIKNKQEATCIQTSKLRSARKATQQSQDPRSPQTQNSIDEIRRVTFNSKDKQQQQQGIQEGQKQQQSKDKQFRQKNKQVLKDVSNQSPKDKEQNQQSNKKSQSGKKQQLSPSGKVLKYLNQNQQYSNNNQKLLAVNSNTKINNKSQENNNKMDYVNKIQPQQTQEQKEQNTFTYDINILDAHFQSEDVIKSILDQTQDFQTVCNAIQNSKDMTQENAKMKEKIFTRAAEFQAQFNKAIQKSEQDRLKFSDQHQQNLDLILKDKADILKILDQLKDQHDLNESSSKERIMKYIEERQQVDNDFYQQLQGLQDNQSKQQSSTEAEFHQFIKEVQTQLQDYQDTINMLKKQNVENFAQTSVEKPLFRTVSVQCNNPHKMMSYMGMQNCPEGFSVLSGYTTPYSSVRKGKAAYANNLNNALEALTVTKSQLRKKLFDENNEKRQNAGTNIQNEPIVQQQQTDASVQSHNLQQERDVMNPDEQQRETRGLKQIQEVVSPTSQQQEVVLQEVQHQEKSQQSSKDKEQNHNQVTTSEDQNLRNTSNHFDEEGDYYEMPNLEKIEIFNDFQFERGVRMLEDKTQFEFHLKTFLSNSTIPEKIVTEDQEIDQIQDFEKGKDQQQDQDLSANQIQQEIPSPSASLDSILDQDQAYVQYEPITFGKLSDRLENLKKNKFMVKQIMPKDQLQSFLNEQKAFLHKVYNDPKSQLLL